MARRKRSSKAHMAYVRSFRKGAKRRKAAPARRKRTSRKSYKRNPYPMAGMVVNPRRKRRARRASSHVARRRRSSASYSRNPRIFGIELPPFEKVAFAAGGFIATPMVEGFVSGYVPASIMSNTFGKYAVRIGVVSGLAYLAGRFLGREKGNQVLIGGGVYVAATAAQEFFPSLLGTHAPSLPVVAPSNVRAYVPANAGVRAYVPASLGMPSAAMLNLESSGAVGGTAVRFKRF